MHADSSSSASPSRKRLLIVGGVAGGASAAARARRLSEEAEIILFERGEDISFANCGLPYHIGGDIPEREALLVQTPESMYGRFRIDVRVRSEVLSIDRQARELVVRDLKTGREYREGYDALILSPGAAPVRPPIPGAESKRVLTLRNMADMDHIKSIIDTEKPERAVVIGGGYIGLEMAEALRRRNVSVVLVERLPQVMTPVDPEIAAPLHQELRAKGVDLRLSAAVVAIREDGNKVTVVMGDGSEVTGSLVIMSVGVKPETTLAVQAGLALGSRGGIKVDEHMRTNDPNIYAVGDAVEVPLHGGGDGLIPLAGPANRQGRIAADVIFGRESSYRSTQGTAICKVFDLDVAVTGLNEGTLKAQGRRYEKIYVHPNNHAEYYPGSSKMALKLLFDHDGRILGAQAVGAGGIDKAIDVLATALRAGMTVYDLEHLELCYAPPYGSAKDPVNYAGFVAANVLRGDHRQIHADQLPDQSDNPFLLDVRNLPELAIGTIPDATVIPLNELRDHLDELPPDRRIIAFCMIGLRGYLAARLLEQHGFDAVNLAGGYKTWKAFGSLPLRAVAKESATT